MSSEHSRRHVWYTLLAACIAISTLAAACGGSSGSSTQPKSSASAGSAGGSGRTNHAAKVKIAFFGYSAANAYTQAALAGVRKVAARTGATVHFYSPNADAGQQVSQVQDAIASGQYNTFVVYSVSGQAVVPAVKQALQKGITVVADFVPVGPNIDTAKIQVQGLSGSVVTPIGDTGTDVGELVVAACRTLNPCRVAYLPGDNTLPLEIDRTNRFKKVVHQHPNIKLVSTIQGGYTVREGYSAAQTVLTANPNVNVIASNDQAIVGTEKVLRSRKLLGKVKLIGLGGTTQAIAGIKQGTWYGDVVNCPTTEAEKATRIAVRARLGKPVKDRVINSLTICGVPTKLTKANVDGYSGQWSV